MYNTGGGRGIGSNLWGGAIVFAPMGGGGLVNCCSCLTGKHLNKCNKRAVFMKTIEFGYIKYKLEGVLNFLHTQGGVNHFVHKAGCNFFKEPTKFS